MDVSLSDVHRGILMVLTDAFEKGIFTEFIPDLIYSSYLGPDANTISVGAAAMEVKSGGASSQAGLIFAICSAVR